MIPSVAGRSSEHRPPDQWPERIAVVGPGALGCLLAAFLCRDRQGELFLLDHDPDRAALLRRQGLILEMPGSSDGRAGHFFVPVVDDPRMIGPVDLIFLCVKSQALAASLAGLSPLCHQQTLLLAMQNGIAHPPLLSQSALPGAWALAVTSLGANLAEVGRVRFGGAGRTFCGFPASLTQEGWMRGRLRQAEDLLNRIGLATEVSESIEIRLWDKLLVNLGINPLTAICRCANGDLLNDKKILARLRAAVLEGAMVAEAKGIRLSADPVARCLAVCRATAANFSSMLQDVRRGKKTEIEAITGALLSEAERLEIPTPINRELYEAVRALEQRQSVSNAEWHGPEPSVAYGDSR